MAMNESTEKTQAATADADPGFVRVLRIKRLSTCPAHERNPAEIRIGCACRIERYYELVPAKLVEVPCRHCNGTGRVLEKVPEESP